ncbi:MAG: hypothetical protein D8M28_00600 [Proteobacteria bacterium]|nr:hypothetical protein [Pseudomonadota bacterium]
MKYDAVTLDTNIFTNNGYALEHGLLNQLEQFKKGSVKFILSEIVVKEVLRHITAENVEIRTNLDKAINRARGKRLLTEKTAEKLIKLTEDEPSPKVLAQNRLDAFQKNTGCAVIKADSAEISALIKRYFNYQPPFENNAEKKNEFPDAIALLSLEKNAKENNLKILAVSKDKGWINFAKTSDWIDVRSDFTEALSELQSHAEEAKEVVVAFLNRVVEDYDSEEYKIIKTIVEQSVADIDFIAEADSYLRAEATFNAEVHFHDFSFLNPESISVVQIGKDFVVAEIPIHIDAHASAEFDFYVYDSIDKDEVYMGSRYIEDEEIDFKAAILITLEIDDNKEMQVVKLTDVELIKVIDRVDFGEIEPFVEPGDIDEWMG